MEYKQVIVVRADLKLPKGKLAAQAAHAAVEATLKADADSVSNWRRFGQKKVVTKVADEKALFAVAQSAKDAGLPVSIITDAGKTVIAPGTTTCCAIGPEKEEIVDRFTSELSLL